MGSKKKLFYKEALRPAPALNLTDLDALILIFSPVWGFTPSRAARLVTEKYRSQLIELPCLF